jgi:hypothetical protein
MNPSLYSLLSPKLFLADPQTEDKLLPLANELLALEKSFKKEYEELTKKIVDLQDTITAKSKEIWVSHKPAIESVFEDRGLSKDLTKDMTFGEDNVFYYRKPLESTYLFKDDKYE